MKQAAAALWIASVCMSAACAQDKSYSGQVLEDFTKRVQDYVKLRKVVKAEMHGLKPTTSPEAIEHYERKLAHELREARRTAKPGDIFAPAIAAEFKRLIGITMQGPEGARVRETLRSAEPVRLSGLRLNGPYPAGVPLQSTPPSLLLNLPSLPPEVDYRLVGRTLLLRDVEANLIVDYIPDVIS
jgi:hypothetical protein